MITFIASLTPNLDWSDCHLWTIVLNVNSTLHSQKSLCGCDCQGFCGMEPGENSMDRYGSFAKSCSFKVKLDIEHQTRLHLQLQSKTETITSNNIFMQVRCTESNFDNPSMDPASLVETIPPNHEWIVDPDRWTSSYLSFYHSLVRSTMNLNLSPQPEGQAPQISADQPPFDFPIFVMNLPYRSDRRRSTQALLRALGFDNVVFPNVTLASAIDPDALIRDRAVSPEAIHAITTREDLGPGALHAYLANALDQVGVVRAAVEQGLHMFAIMEDDLMPVGDAREVRGIIAEALRQLPATADMLYLEYCFDECQAQQYPFDNPWPSRSNPATLRAAGPACTAATIFTLQGAENVLELCDPIFNGIDNM